MESQDPLHLFWRHIVFALPHSFIEEESLGENRRHCVGLGASVFRDTIPGLDILYVLYNTQCDQGKYKLSHHLPSLPHFFRPSLCIPGKEKKSKAATYQFSPYAYRISICLGCKVDSAFPYTGFLRRLYSCLDAICGRNLCFLVEDKALRIIKDRKKRMAFLPVQDQLAYKSIISFES